MSSAPKILLCPPDFYEVGYAINDWMDPDTWQKDPAGWKQMAVSEWQALEATLNEVGIETVSVGAVDGLPDMVFTANCAIVLDGKVLIGRYRNRERHPETEHIAAWFESEKAKGAFAQVSYLPDGEFQEGTGDCVWDAHRGLFWAGYGPRSSLGSHDVIRETFGKKLVSLELVGDKFYHMDVCLMPLARGEVLYFPECFTDQGRTQIKELVGEDLLIEASAEDAAGFAVNCVSVGDAIILSSCTDNLKKTLESRGYSVHVTPLSAYLLSGGGAFCMTLRLDY